MDTGMGFGDAQVPLSEASGPTTSTYLENPELALSYLKSIYPSLKRHYDWFRRTQRGQIKQYGRKARSRTEAYRWRGRTASHVLTSGMDDYPRGEPHAGELHLDLISWMAFFSRTMRDIATYIGEVDDAQSFIDIEKAIIDNIEGISDIQSFKQLLTLPSSDLHWNEQEQMYCDVSVNSDGQLTHIVRTKRD